MTESTGLRDGDVCMEYKESYLNRWYRNWLRALQPELRIIAVISRR